MARFGENRLRGQQPNHPSSDCLHKIMSFKVVFTSPNPCLSITEISSKNSVLISCRTLAFPAPLLMLLAGRAVERGSEVHVHVCCPGARFCGRETGERTFPIFLLENF